MILKFHYHQQEKVLMDYYYIVKLWIPNSHGQKFSIPQKSFDPPTLPFPASLIFKVEWKKMVQNLKYFYF